MNFMTVIFISAIEEICEQKGEYINCPFGKVLDIINVDYGRSRVGFCNPYNVANLPTNCHSTSITTNTVIKLCQYRSSCFLEADNTILGKFFRQVRFDATTAMRIKILHDDLFLNTPYMLKEFFSL